MSRRFEHHSLFKSFVFIWHGRFSFGNVGRVLEIEKSLVNISRKLFLTGAFLAHGERVVEDAS